jgi:hypothetical protein
MVQPHAEEQLVVALLLAMKNHQKCGEKKVKMK